MRRMLLVLLVAVGALGWTRTASAYPAPRAETSGSSAVALLNGGAGHAHAGRGMGTTLALGLGGIVAFAGTAGAVFVLRRRRRDQPDSRG